MLKTRTKIEAAVAVVFLCILAGMSLQATYLSYTGSNGTYAWTSTDKSFIECSPSGNRFNATETGLRKAIYSMANSTGTIDCNFINISISSTVYLPTGGLTLKNFKFYLADNANCSLFKNYGWKDVALSDTRGIENLTMRDGFINGNMYHQPRWVHNNGYEENTSNRLMMFVYTNHSTFENIEITNSLWGTMMRGCHDNIYTNLRFYNIGLNYTGLTVAVETPDGDYSEALPTCLWFTSSSNNTITNCIMRNLHDSGIVFEYSKINNVYREYSNNNIVDHCIVTDCLNGFWIEHATKITISNSQVLRATKHEAYKMSNVNCTYGIVIGPQASFCVISNCKVLDSGYLLAPASGLVSAIYCIGRFNTITGCIIDTYDGNGTTVTGNATHTNFDNKIENCIIRNCSYYGISYTTAATTTNLNPQIIGNTIYNTTHQGISVYSTSTSTRSNNKIGCIMGNNLNKCGLYSDSTNGNAIQCSVSNISICNNMINYSYTGILLIGITAATKTQGNQVNNNHVTTTNSIGIYISQAGNGTCNDNVVYNPGATSANVGIQLYKTNNYIVANNRVRGATDANYALREYTPCNYNLWIGNHYNGNTKDVLYLVGASSQNVSNYGG